MAGVNPFRKGPKGDQGPAAGARSHETAAPAPADPTALPAERTTGAPQERGRRASLVARVTGAGRAGAAGGRHRVRAAVAAIADRIIEAAPRIPVRDLATLRTQFPGLTPEELADKLVAGARAGTATVGAGVGAAAMLPVPPAMPAELAAEVVGVASVEIKLIAELHEVYGLRPPGTFRQRTTAYLTSWTQERGVDITAPASLNIALGGQMKRELRQQIMKRTLRNLPNLTPFLIGAAVGALTNRRSTGRLAEKIRRDLRTKQVPWNALPDTGGPATGALPGPGGLPTPGG
ncbi:hypothetical protein SSP35_13_00340 [Streptomyces sp. NBRC 110611]|uniref:hypothetical protein n=1 Tax=Streptomyces sp. NBRC 110611 TaxID=1621259 RepID=UPI00082AACD1|nr:hypothetical protein [Streptomyces sp. NBRC 110611]GAU69564.1 hypothetical protein SSP35_13_00340 [Streptomyces sp. NBRC 110611]